MALIAAISSSSRCSFCKQELGESQVMKLPGRSTYFHPSCFRCSVCNAELGTSYVPFKGGFYLCGRQCKRKAALDPSVLQTQAAATSAVPEAQASSNRSEGNKGAAQITFNDEKRTVVDADILSREVEQSLQVSTAAPLTSVAVAAFQQDQTSPGNPPTSRSTPDSAVSLKQIAAARKCMICKNAVDTTQPFLKLPNGLAFHQECFVCAICHKALGTKFLPFRGGHYLCSLQCKREAGLHPERLAQKERWVHEAGSDKAFEHVTARDSDVKGDLQRCQRCRALWAVGARFCLECGASKD